MPKIKVEEKIKYFLPNNYYKNEITCSSLTSTPFFFAERKPRCNIVACAGGVWHRKPQHNYQKKKLATTHDHCQQHQHLSPNHFVVALPQRHLEHRSPRRSIQLARNQAKRWRHSTKSIFSLYLPHPPIIDVVDNAGPRCSQSLKRVDRLPLVHPVQPGHFSFISQDDDCH